MCSVHEEVNRNSKLMKSSVLLMAVNENEDENVMETNESTVRHTQTLKNKRNYFELKNSTLIRTLPGFKVKFAARTGASASTLGSSYSLGGTNNGLHRRVDARLFSNNF